MIESPFSSLSADAARALVDASAVRQADAGEVVFTEGEAGDSLLLISSGLVAVQVPGAGGSPVTVAMRGPGEMLGEMALFARSGRRTATTVTRAATRFLELDSASFDSLRATRPEVDDLFLRILAERSASLTWRLAEGDDLDPSVRLARRLLDLPTGGDPGAPTPVTDDDLAGLSGMSVQRVSDLLADLQRSDVIEHTDGVAILDRPALTRAASLP